jgi:hypothetical protein
MRMNCKIIHSKPKHVGKMFSLAPNRVQIEVYIVACVLNAIRSESLLANNGIYADR